MSEKFCQDDVENYFGSQRAVGRRKDNPNVKDRQDMLTTQYNLIFLYSQSEGMFFWVRRNGIQSMMHHYQKKVKFWL